MLPFDMILIHDKCNTKQSSDNIQSDNRVALELFKPKLFTPSPIDTK